MHICMMHIQYVTSQLQFWAICYGRVFKVRHAKVIRYFFPKKAPTLRQVASDRSCRWCQLPLLPKK